MTNNLTIPILTVVILILSFRFTTLLIENDNYKHQNKLLELNYSIPNNYYTVKYVFNKDTLILDYTHPIELDSLVKSLNKY